MAILFKGSHPLFLSFILFSFSHLFLVTCTEFEVGGDNGWVVPKSKNDSQMYNQWASKTRFLVGDTVRFKYKKDSVMAVSEEEYGKCKSSRPLYFSNNGDSVFKFDRPGLFFFISGVSGHCDRGQKLIVKVLETEHAHSPQSANEDASRSPQKAAAAQITRFTKTTSPLFGLSFLALLFA